MSLRQSPLPSADFSVLPIAIRQVNVFVKTAARCIEGLTLEVHDFSCGGHKERHLYPKADQDPGREPLTHRAPALAVPGWLRRAGSSQQSPAGCRGVKGKVPPM